MYSENAIVCNSVDNYFFLQNARKRTVNGDMPGAASFWLWNKPMNLKTTSVEAPNFVRTLSKEEDQRKLETRLIPEWPKKGKGQHSPNRGQRSPRHVPTPYEGAKRLEVEEEGS